MAAGGLALVTAGLLVWTSPETRAKLARVRWKAVAPKAAIVLIIAAPLVAWTASSASGDEKPRDLRVQRGTALTGKPELLVSLGEDDMNTLAMANGKTSVRIVCVDRDGKVVVDVRRKWPFMNELGYDYPHTHLVISREQVRGAQKCSVRGTRMRLQAEVEGRLPR
jgi:hypothetical protein